MSDDPDRYKVYAAESYAFEGLAADTRPGHDEVCAAAEWILRSPWWAENVGRRVTIRQSLWGDDDNPESVAWHRRSGVAEVAFGASAPLHHVTHELAHCAQPERSLGHGSKFRGWHIATASAYFGPEVGARLADAYGMLNLRVIHPALPYTNTIHLPDAPITGGWKRPGV